MPPIYCFADFELRPVERCLLRQGSVQVLGARGFDLLLALVEQGGALVSKDMLLQRAWPGLVVEEANVHVQVSQLRKLLGADTIATSAGLGYRFALPVHALGTAAPRHNLPAERTGFVGRQAALQDARARLASTRLLTLIGIGGTGKTRLALKLAEQLLPAYADGVWWVDLAPLDSAGQLAPAVAQALGCRLQGATAATDLLAAHLHGRRMLVVLDNGEHLLDAVATLADSLLAAAPGLQLLATSREALGLPGELLLPVRPLALPAPAGCTAEIAQAEAVLLFADRAAQAAPGFVLDEASAPVVADICRRVDGIPLALEIAAAQLRVLAPAQLLDLLQARFRDLVGQRRALPRQQTLQAVIQWSHDHLQPDEQQLLAALAVCSGGCDLDAAAALAAPGTSRATLLSGLARLVELSMLVVNQAGATARYLLLETVRQFALDQLQASGRAAGVRDRHAQHFLAIAQAHDEVVQRHGEGAASLDRLDAERDNLLSALAWCDRDDDAGGDGLAASTGLRLVVALRHYWPSRGLLATGLKLTNAALARAAGLAPDRDTLWALTSVTHMHAILGQHAQALAPLNRCRDLALASGDALWVAITDGQLGSIAAALGRFDEAEAHHLASLRGAEALQDDRRIGDALGGLSALAALRGRPQDAEPYLARVLALRRQAGHGYNLATALLNAASNALELDDLPRVRTLLGEAAVLTPRVGSLFLAQHLIDRVASLMRRCAAWGPAVQLYAASARQRQATGLPLVDDDALQQQAELATAQATLGDADFQAAWAAGLALNPAQTLDLAALWLADAAAPVAAVPVADPKPA